MFIAEIEKKYQVYNLLKNHHSSLLGVSTSAISLFGYEAFKKKELHKERIACPFLGRRPSCGLFGIGDDFLEKYQSLDERFIKNKASTFFFEASGDSMSPTILPGDILIVDRSLEFQHGKVIICCIDDMMVCKRFSKNENGVILKSDNKKMKPIYIKKDTNLIIFGVVTAIAREY